MEPILRAAGIESMQLVPTIVDLHFFCLLPCTLANNAHRWCSVVPAHWAAARRGYYHYAVIFMVECNRVECMEKVETH